MSTREYFYNTKTDQYAVAVLTKDSSGEERWILKVFGQDISADAAYDLADQPEWIEITKDNADLFIDTLDEEIENFRGAIDTATLLRQCWREF